ncbi:hypothetical protein CYMTET_34557 [Cymbomonas tetramitiformis]|uniref:Uncharacterized protein n=1 Tax=Cymbomonas tetramitiformis TaxID=36881 RepID=A0AAE0FAX2_9CHLO|nr:hypothetical protein CYMTET_34557 [Cymbomonas tetramitiformis]
MGAGVSNGTSGWMESYDTTKPVMEYLGKVSAENERMFNEVKSAGAEIASLKKSGASFERDKSALTEELNKANLEKQSLQNERKALIQEKDGLRVRLESICSQKDELASRLTAAEDKLREVQKTSNEKAAHLESSAKKLDAAQKATDEAQSKIENLTAESEEAQAALNKQAGDIRSLSEESEAAILKADDLAQQLAAVAAALAASGEETAVVKIELDKRNTDCAAKSKEIEALRLEVASLRAVAKDDRTIEPTMETSDPTSMLTFAPDQPAPPDASPLPAAAILTPAPISDPSQPSSQACASDPTPTPPPEPKPEVQVSPLDES